MTFHFDVIVLGCGPSGSTAAWSLARSSVSVLIVEEKHPASFKIGETIPSAAQMLFSKAGLENVLMTVPRLRCSGNRSAWGSDEIQIRSSLLDPYGGSSHIDRLAFDQAALTRAITAGAELARGARPRAWSRRPGGWYFDLPQPLGRISCDSVIDCTGRRAVFARSQGARRVAIDRQVGVIAQLPVFSDPDLSITIEAVESGWWYSAQVPTGKRIVVHFSDNDLLSGHKLKSANGVSALMMASKHISAFADGATVELLPSTVLADTAYLTMPAGEGWCAAGDAAFSSDPLAAMGIVNAVQAGLDASKLVLAGFSPRREYCENIVGRAATHIKQRREYYLMERRWAQSPFWLRRHAQGPPPENY